MRIWKATTQSEMSAREKDHMEKVRRFAAEGMVLLENDGTLPFRGSMRKIALFGNGARHMVKGGKGSGDVNSRSIVGVEQGILEAGCEVVSSAWLDAYDRLCTDTRNAYNAHLREIAEQTGNPMNAFAELFSNPYHEPDVQAITDDDMADADAAVYVVARDSGEGRDRTPVEGDYELTATEKENIRKLAGRYDKFVVALNVGGVIDTKALRATPGLGAVLLMSQAGNVTGTVLADVLFGKSVPSGHLAMTWAEDYSDYPAYDTFGSRNGDVDDEYYTEGIFVGYRYFDTFGKKPAYPFGYGLSYTDFRLQVKEVTLAGETVKAAVEVKNIGEKYRGKQLVQLYVSAPAGRLEKPVKELKTFAKTKELMPGESEVLVLSVKVSEFASYDEASASYILEPGRYFIRIGENACSTHIAAAVEVADEIVTAKLSNRFRADAVLKEISAMDARPLAYDGENEEKLSAQVLTLADGAINPFVAGYEGAPVEFTCDRPETLTLADVKSGNATMEELLGQLTREEMADLCVGTARGGWAGESAIGTASAIVPGAAGDTSSKMACDRGVHNLVLADIRVRKHTLRCNGQCIGG